MKERDGYSDNLRAEALKLIVEQGMSLKEVSNLVGLFRGTVGSWVAKAQKQMLQAKPRTPSTQEEPGTYAPISSDKCVCPFAIYC